MRLAALTRGQATHPAKSNYTKSISAGHGPPLHFEAETAGRVRIPR
jgi:hypothetical protein